VSKRVAGIDVLDKPAKSGCPNSLDGRQKWGVLKILTPNITVPPKNIFLQPRISNAVQLFHDKE
jgi:hypothetical protein